MDRNTRTLVFGVLLGAIGTGALLTGIKSSHGDERAGMVRPRITIPSVSPVAPPALVLPAGNAREVAHPAPAIGEGLPEATTDNEAAEDAGARHERLILTAEDSVAECYLNENNPLPVPDQVNMWVSITDASGRPFLVPSASNFTIKGISVNRKALANPRINPGAVAASPEQTGVWQVTSGSIQRGQSIFSIHVRVRKNEGGNLVIYEGQTLASAAINFTREAQ